MSIFFESDHSNTDENSGASDEEKGAMAYGSGYREVPDQLV